MSKISHTGCKCKRSSLWATVNSSVLLVWMTYGMVVKKSSKNTFRFFFTRVSEKSPQVDTYLNYDGYYKIYFCILFQEIEAAAMMLPEMPLFLVMDRVLSNSSINVIIDCMKNMQRYDILNYLHGYVIGKISTSSTEKKLLKRKILFTHQNDDDK